VGYEVSPATARKIKALLERGQKTPTPVNVSRADERYDAHVVVTGPGDGIFPCVVTTFNADTFAWEDYDGEGLVVDENDAPLVEGRRYRCLHYGAIVTDEAGSDSDSGNNNGHTNVYVATSGAGILITDVCPTTWSTTTAPSISWTGNTVTLSYTTTVYRLQIVDGVLCHEVVSTSGGTSTATIPCSTVEVVESLGACVDGEQTVNPVTITYLDCSEES
jgi:hypothetical protein